MKRYALVGTGARAGMFITALTQTFRDACELVGLCDVSSVRMRWYQRQLEEACGVPPPLYQAKDFDQMVRETKPDVVIVTTVDAYHHLYISRAMQLGCDVITEKPLTIDADKLQVIFDAVEQTGRSLRVAFNYRYAPAYSRLRALLKQGTIGKPLNIDFSWLLDRSHGADYFRRWHSEKVKSGGLLVHKASHHFDLVNWWLGDYPKEVFALGDLLFYGRGNAAARGEHYNYERYTDATAARDPYALYLDKDERMRGLYLDAEAESGYLRDRNVFGDHITIEDTMTVTARYRGGALLSYCLLAYAPWEGLRVALTGTEGRAELEVVESVNGLAQDASDLSASKGAFKKVSLRVFPAWSEAYEVEVPESMGEHGGADPLMLEHLFSPSPPSDPLNRAASHVDGAASVLLGIAANVSMASEKLVQLDDLFLLH